MTADVQAEASTALLTCIPGENRSKVFLATKFANNFDRNTREMTWNVRGDKAYVRSSCEESLQRLGIKQIDLYYQHRVDPKVPVEETMAEMVALQKEGKIKYIGISECSADTLRRACKVSKPAPFAATRLMHPPYLPL